MYWVILQGVDGYVAFHRKYLCRSTGIQYGAIFILLPRLNLCLYRPVRHTGIYFGSGTPCEQFYLSQWRHAVQLRYSKCHKNTNLLCARCVYQAQSAQTLVFGLGYVRTLLGELTTLPYTP